MAVAAPKIAVHLYLNNPYGLISATIPNYSINKVELADKMSPIVDTEYQDTENISKVAKANNVEPEVPKARGMQKPEVQDGLNKKWKPLPDIKPGTRTTTSGEYYTPSATVFFAKPSGNNQRMGGDPNLGFTWSINLDKKEKILSPRQPPPPSLLDKLGRLKKVDQFGKTNKNQEKLLASSRYIIKKLDVSDSKQRKMSEKLSEWLDQYTAVSQNQQHYLSRIHELRRGLETKEDKHLMQTIENLRSQHKEKYKRKFPIYSLTRMEGTAVNQGPAPFPSRPCLYHDDKHGIPKLKIAPHTSPRKLAPIVKRADTKYTVIKNEHKKHQVTPRPEMSSMRTEYETFESIARRNKLNLPQFFNQTNGNYRKVGNKRLPMSVSTVTIIEEHPEEDTEHKAFTSDHLSKKHTVTLKDQKPG